MEFIVGTNLRVAEPDDMVECISTEYSRIKKGAILRVAQTCPSPKTDSNWSYKFAGIDGIFKGINFRRVDDKFNPQYGGQSRMAQNTQQNQDTAAEDFNGPVPEIRVYFMQFDRIVHRMLQVKNETAEEFLARADAFIRKNPTAVAHVYRKVALRRTSPAPIENIEL